MPNLADLVSVPVATPAASGAAQAGAQVRVGYVLNTPAAATDDLFVVIRAFDGDQKIGPVLWTPRDGDLPAAGDACRLLDSADGAEHIVVWLQPH